VGVEPEEELEDLLARRLRLRLGGGLERAHKALESVREGRAAHLGALVVILVGDEAAAHRGEDRRAATAPVGAAAVAVHAGARARACGANVRLGWRGNVERGCGGGAGAKIPRPAACRGGVIRRRGRGGVSVRQSGLGAERVVIYGEAKGQFSNKFQKLVCALAIADDETRPMSGRAACARVPCERRTTLRGAAPPCGLGLDTSSLCRGLVGLAPPFSLLRLLCRAAVAGRANLPTKLA
jgi:hypothetical protein